MSTINKKGTASKALMEMDSIMKSIKEESKSTMKALLSEAVKDALRDSANEDEDKEYEVVDDENAENEEGTEQNASEDTEDVLEKYKVGEDTYDLTGEEDNDAVVKVYKLLSDDDQVIIKKDGDKVELKDAQTGAEYVIDLGAEESEKDEDEEPLTDDVEEDEVEQLDESILETGEDEEIPVENDDDQLRLDGEDVELNHGDEDISDEEIQAMIDNLDSIESGKHTKNGESMGIDAKNVEGMQFESKKSKKTMKESKNSKEVLFEIDLGYTDDYQKEDPIEGLSNNEPSKSGKSWHKGVPTGTEKPWAGETSGKGDPFAKEVNEEFDECGNKIFEEDEVDADAAAGFNDEELEEAATSKTRRDRRHATKTNSKATGDAQYNPEVTKVDNGALQESLKKLKKENKSLQEAVLELRNSLKEAYITNVNLGKITKLFLENTTTKAEKIDIINRFTNEAKTVDQSNALFESINKQLKKAPQMSQIAESNAGKTMTGSKLINENKTHRTKDVLEVIDLMDRMKNC